MHYLTEIVRSGIPFGEVIRITGPGGPGGQDELLGIAVLTNSEGQDFRRIFVNTICKDPGFTDLGAGLCEHAESVRTVETTDSQFMDAITEYYSIMLVNRMLCDRCISTKKPFSEIFSESRVGRLTTLLKMIEQSGNADFTGMDVLEICCGNGMATTALSELGCDPFCLDSDRCAGMDVLEICCGNGMATTALSELGCDPFCLDSDRCAICEGLEHGVLAPRRSAVLDATELSAFFDAESFDCVIGFMLGAIYPFNKDLWARIMSESAVLLRENGLFVFTVHKEEEITILKEVMDEIGISGEIIDNRDDAGVYDQWVYLGRKGSSAG
jgi:SAM-dependent methyltransferase